MKIYRFLAALLCVASLSIPAKSQNPVNQTIQLTTTIQPARPSITFTWDSIPGAASFQVYRKLESTPNWGAVKATLPGTAKFYVDTTVAIGTGYEYKFYMLGTDTATTYVYSGIELPVTEARGKMILLVDSSMADSLHNELHQLETDLIGDGWTVIRGDFGRNVSDSVVKKFIMQHYYADPANVKSVFIFGHVAVPYSGDINPDGHPNHIGAWGCDDYYGDMDSAWTDITVDDTSAANTQNWNKPHDGKFDQSFLSDMGDIVNLEVGRVDLSNLPSFPYTETHLLRQYLNKDHNYKFKNIIPRRQGFIADNFGSYNHEYFASTGWRNFTALFNAANITANSSGYFTDQSAQSFLFSYGCGGGTYTSASGVGSTTDFVNDSIQSVFTMLFGSYFGDWNNQDDFLRAPLASRGWTLTDCWAGRPYWNFQHMGMGETIGFCTKLSENSNGVLYITNPTYPWLGQMIHMGLMGDPSLRLHTVAPPSNLVSSVQHGPTAINLNWAASAPVDSVLGYYMYRLDTATQIYLRISPSIIAGLSFADNAPTNGNNYYMVRAIRLEKSASGTYYNLSQGVFDTAFINLTGIPSVVSVGNSMKVYPNPAQNMVSVSLQLGAASTVRITLLDLTGKTVLTDANQTLAAGGHILNLNTSALPDGIYYIRLQSAGSPDCYAKLAITGH